MPEVITSHANRTVKRYRSLAARKNRRRESAFAVEGLQPVWRAVTSSWQVDTLIVAPDLVTNEAATRMVRAEQQRGTSVVEVSAEVFRHLSDRDGPAGLAAIVRGEIAGLGEFQPAPTGPIVALHRVGNPGNIGTVLRSLDAAGAAGLILVGQCADPLAPAAVKASMGSLFAVPLAACPDMTTLADWAASDGRRTVAVTGRTERSLWTAAVDPGAVLIFGSEGDGLPDEIAEACDAAVMIPMQGTAESLNLATATSVTVFELARRRETEQA